MEKRQVTRVLKGETLSDEPVRARGELSAECKWKLYFI